MAKKQEQEEKKPKEEKPSKETLEKAKQELYYAQKDLELLEEEFELRTKFKELMLKAPNVVDAKYAYERLSDYTDLKRKDIEFAYKSWYFRTYKPKKEYLQERINDYKKFLKKWGERV